MSKSIIQDRKECFVCKTTYQLEEHHIFRTPFRKSSEKYGLKVWLCHQHHQGNNGVHGNNKALDIHLKQLAQKTFEKKYGHEMFMKIFMRNYLN